MLGCNVNEGGNPNVTYKTCIEIRKWDSSPQSIGCIEYKGKYYVNNLPGNMTKPDQGLSSGSYAVGSSDYCDIIKYHLANQTTNPDSAIFIKFFSGIREYSISGTNEVFDCDEFMIFENELHQSLVNNNNRHPHDRSVWKKLGDLSTILKLIFDDSDGKQLTLPYWEECIGANCTTVYQKGISVVERVNSGKVDNCGNTIYDEQIFLSLIDNNTDRPSIGAAKPIPTWQGPFTDTQFLNRPVGYTQNGEPIAPGDTHTLITKDALCDKFEWSTVEICSTECGDKTKEVICPKPIGTDENGDIITNGSNITLISQAAPYHPLKWIDVENGECTQDCEELTDKRLTLCYADGLHEVEECLEVKPADSSIIVDANGVKVGQIGVDRANAPILADTCLVTCNQVGDGIFYDTTSNKWEVKPANSSITVDATGVKVNIADGADSSIIVDENGVKVGEIGKDPAGNPINVNDCLITCDDLGNGLILAGNKVVVKAADDSIIVDENGIRANLIPDSDVTIADTNESRGSPIKVDQQGLNAEGDPHYVADYNTANTPSTTAATPKPWRLVIEASDGKEYVLRSGKGYREHHDGRAEMWGTVLLPLGSEDKAVEVTLPIPLDGAITYTNSHISVTDVGWAAAAGQDLDDLPTVGISDPSVDAFNNTDVGWAPSSTDPVGKFVIWPYKHESENSRAIELVSWHLVTERGLS